MVIMQRRPNRKKTGSRYIAFRKKRQCDMGRVPTHPRLGEMHVKVQKVRGMNVKPRILLGNIMNLYDPIQKKHSKVKITNVIENPANRHFVRRNIMTKGTIVETEAGKARITSRPGQDGVLNGILVQ